MDYFTNQPINSSVNLSADDGNQKNAQPAFSLKTVNSDESGNFSIKSTAARTGNYFLFFHSLQNNTINQRPLSTGKIMWVKISDNSTKDFGQIFEATHTFYVVITLNNTSGQHWDFIIRPPFNRDAFVYPYPTPLNTQFVYSIEYSKEEFETNNHNFKFGYELIEQNSSNQSGGSVSIPITSKDTVYTTINY